VIKGNEGVVADEQDDDAADDECSEDGDKRPEDFPQYLHALN